MNDPYLLIGAAFFAILTILWLVTFRMKSRILPPPYPRLGMFDDNRIGINDVAAEDLDPRAREIFEEGSAYSPKSE